MDLIKSNKSKDAALAESLRPRMTFHNGQETPFGRIGEDGEFHIIYDTTSRYGYMARPIYGVKLDEWGYKIFIGECPHKNDEGVWVTDAQVPTFVLGAFGGAHKIDEEPDIPHIIRICVDEYDYEQREKNNKYEKTLSATNNRLSMQILYCTLPMYLKGLWKRMGRRFGTFSYYKGKHSTLYSYTLIRKSYHLQFVNRWSDKSLYICQSYNGWNTFINFRTDGKWKFSVEKHVDSGVCCEA